MDSHFNGQCFEYYENKEIKAEYIYKNGKLNGEQIKYTPGQGSIFIEKFANGRFLGGRELSFYSKNKIDFQTSYDSLRRKVGEYFGFHPNGKLSSIGNYSICKGVYVSKLDSVSRGEILSIDEEFRSVKVRHWVYYFDNGRIQESGNYDTLYLAKSDTSGLEMRINMGVSSSNSGIKIIIDFSDSKIGEWIYFKRDGSLLRREYWEKGQLISISTN
jgi:antitoxin component YwqK of YwqJK toxin-antitoxin module